jgi:hypothetical protein
LKASCFHTTINIAATTNTITAAFTVIIDSATTDSAMVSTCLDINTNEEVMTDTTTTPAVIDSADSSLAYLG